MWTAFFDKIFIISLPAQTQRRLHTEQSLQSYNIPYEIFPAIYNQDGAYGIYLTLNKLLSACVKECEHILVFEDDVHIVTDPSPIMDNVIVQLPKEFDLLYLGVNTHKPFERFYSPNLLPISYGYGLHSVGYSKKGMQKVLSLPGWNGTPIDVMIDRDIQSQGKSFCTYPLIATQRNGYSDIQKKYMDQGYIAERFSNNVKHLL